MIVAGSTLDVCVCVSPVTVVMDVLMVGSTVLYTCCGPETISRERRTHTHTEERVTLVR